jgi:tetratricopeptide (TPR) repeat protein
MPLFKRRETTPITGMSRGELAESDALYEAHGVTTEFANKNVEMARQLMRQYFSELVKRNPTNKFWVYYLLGDLLATNGQLDQAIAVYSRATREYPDDPRAYYSLGAIYYGISSIGDHDNYQQRPDATDLPMELLELVGQGHEVPEENQQFNRACRESKLAASPEDAAKLALQYFRKTLTCNISNEDKGRVQTHIRLIEIRWSL